MSRTDSLGRARLLTVLVVLLAFVALFGLVSTAHAGKITYWSAPQPSGNVGTGIVVTVQGNCAANPAPLVASSARLLIDGVVVPRASYTASVLPTSVYFYYRPTTKFTDGTHTFRVEVTDTAGVLSFREWTATVVQPPTAGWLAPGAGAVLYTGRPVITLSLADNTPLTPFTVTGQVHTGSVAGPVAATFGGTGLPAGWNSFAVSAELAPATYYLTATVKDGAGNALALSGVSARRFTCALTAAMTRLESCDSCHGPYRTAHPTPPGADCALCHPGYDGDHMDGTDFCEDCHSRGWHTGGTGTVVAVSSSCASCHNPERPEVVQHTASSVAPTHASSCGGCHVGSLVDRHATTPAGSVYANQCDLCHANTDSRVQAAITAGDRSCSACHDAAPGHGFDPAQHEASAGGDVLAGSWPAVGDNATYNPSYAYAFTCADCHDMTIGGAGGEHDKATSSSAAEGCENCHPTPRGTFSSWDGSCSQGGCHPTGTATAEHSAVSTIHAMGQSDIDGGCGFIGTNGRRPCHYRDIVQEHNRTINERLDPFTNDPVLRAVSVTCVECHSSQEFAALNGVWDGGCGACHPENHTVAGTDRYDAVYAMHDNPAGYYDNGSGASGSNAMDAHGPLRHISDTGSPNKIGGCGQPTCHTQGYLGPGFPYPNIGCASCHGPSTAVPDPYQGSFSWFSDSWLDHQSLDSKLTMTLDPITLPAASSLDFKTWYDIERDWDYGYVQISTDDGATWTPLASAITTTTDPNGMNAGNGITGPSGGWVDGHFDLSAYAGQTVKIRFSYQGDFYAYGLGWMLDVITVGPEGAPVFSDDCETLRPEWAVETYVSYWEWSAEQEKDVLVTVPSNQTGWKRYTRTP